MTLQGKETGRSIPEVNARASCRQAPFSRVFSMALAASTVCSVEFAPTFRVLQEQTNHCINKMMSWRETSAASMHDLRDAPPQLCARRSSFPRNTHHRSIAPDIAMDVDKLFKVSSYSFVSPLVASKHSLSLRAAQLPKLPNASLNKRKWVEPTNEALKAARVDDVPSTSASSSSAAPSAAARRPRASVADGSDDEAAGSDGEFAPGNDADYFVDEDDEGGRFFGGGLTDEQKRIIEIMAMGDQESGERKPEEELRDLRRALLRFEKAVNKNAELRVRYEGEPSR